jgi:hypothetical protein
VKRNKYHIILTWILLSCFAAGQYVVYAHQHAGVSTGRLVQKTSAPAPKHTIAENCRLCDAMQHNSMSVNSPVHFANVTVSGYVYKTFQYNFVSIALILSSGRAPPAAGTC